MEHTSYQAKKEEKIANVKQSNQWIIICYITKNKLSLYHKLVIAKCVRLVTQKMTKVKLGTQ